MKFPVNCAAIGCAGLLLAGCRESGSPQVPAVAPSPAEAGVPLNSLSRKQREAHRILKTTDYLTQGLAVLTELEAKGQLAWRSDNKPDLVGVAGTLRRVREEIARTESDETKDWHNESLALVDEVMNQMVEMGNQAILPENSKEAGEFAAALISATDALETTSSVLGN